MESHFHCEFDNLEIYSDFSLDPTSRLAKLCGNLTMQSPVIQSPSGKMLVKMKTDLSNHFKGFQGYVTYSYGEVFGRIMHSVTLQGLTNFRSKYWVWRQPEHVRVRNAHFEDTAWILVFKLPLGNIRSSRLHCANRSGEIFAATVPAKI